MPPSDAAPAGVVRLGGEPLLRARRTFHLVAGGRLRGFVAVRTNRAGRSEVHGLPLRSFPVTVASDTAAVPPEYTDHRQTPLHFVGDRVGPVSGDFDQDRSAPG